MRGDRAGIEPRLEMNNHKAAVRTSWAEFVAKRAALLDPRNRIRNVAINFAEILALAGREQLLVAREGHAHKDQRIAAHQRETKRDRADANPFLSRPDGKDENQS